MKNRQERRFQQDGQAGLRDQLKILLLELDLLENEIQSASAVSRNLWWGWRGHRRSVEDLAALIHHGGAV